MNERVLLEHFERIASDVGRLKRRLPEESSDRHALDRISASVETIDALVQPTAAQVYRANRAFGAGEDESVTAALEDVDRRQREMRVLLSAPLDRYYIRAAA